MKKKTSVDEFIEKAKKIHGDKYDYIPVKDFDMKKVKIDVGPTPKNIY